LHSLFTDSAIFTGSLPLFLEKLQEERASTTNTASATNLNATAVEFDLAERVPVRCADESPSSPAPPFIPTR
jgi:hypothetical protein